MTNITVYRGDTFKRTISFKDEAGTAIDITGSVITFSIKEKVDDTSFVAQGIATITDGPNGLASLTVSSDDMDLTPKLYVYDLERIDSSLIVRTIISGTIIISYDITTN